MQQRGPGEAEGDGRVLGGLWRRLVCRPRGGGGEQRGRRMREVDGRGKGNSSCPVDLNGRASECWW